MAITNYTNLQTAIASWHHRDVAEIPDFIRLAELRINSMLESRMAEFDTTLTATIATRYIALPTGYSAILGLWLTTYDPRREIRYRLPEDLPVTTLSSGQPYYYTVDGSNIAFERPADIAYTYTLRYQKAYDIASTSTNDILTNYPDVYLFGSLVEACIFAKDDPAMFEQRFQAAISNAQKSEMENKRFATLSSDHALTGGYGRIRLTSGGM